MQSYHLGYRVDTAGAPLAGGKAYFYLTGTTTLEDVFEDSALATALSNPVIADANGFFPELVYLDQTKTYRVVIKTAVGVTIAAQSADPINTPLSGGGIDGADINDDSIPGSAFAPGAVEGYLGYTPGDEADVVALQTQTGALTGMVAPFLASSAPTGWVKGNGGTIGDATSGGTTRANADTSALFALIWALDATEFPITDSSGGSASRGATAAADFALHMRLPLPDLRAEFVRGLDDSRGVDTSRLLGSDQAGQMSAHTHSAGFTDPQGRSDASVDMITPTNSGGLTAFSTGSAGGTENSSENRPRNVALLYCIKL